VTQPVVYFELDVLVKLNRVSTLPFESDLIKI